MTPVPPPPVAAAGGSATSGRRRTVVSEDSRTLVHTDPSRRTDPALTMPTDVAAFVRPPGQIVAGRYELVEPIGEGSMGRIFLAEQISVGRRVAIKIINRELGAKYDTIARFQQEARLLASVKNEHIVDIYDIGETEQGDPFIAMEYVDGQSLAQMLRAEGALDAARTIRLSLQVASALATVHEAGVVHRDLKPANIMLTRVGSAELVKILDFGLAKVLSDREASGRLTRTGSIIGTPEYMSPEQVGGSGIDHRADLYGFGCTAYEMACGRPPFTGAEVATLYKHLHEDVPPLTSVRPDFPPALAQVIHRCLAKNPADRYQTARELHAALLVAADRSGVSRHELRAPRAGIDLGAEAAPLPAPIGTPAARYPRREVALIAATVLVLGVLAGVLIDRAMTGGRGGAVPSSATGPAGAGAGAAAAANDPGVLLVSTTPSGVDVIVDGGKPGKSPLVVRGLAPGKHRIEVRGRGWMPREGEVVVEPGRLAEVDFKLERPRYTLRLESVPSGASVTLDGKLLGETPLDAKVAEHEFHQLAFSHDGYRTREMFLAPDSHETKIVARLYPVLLNAGSVIINSEHAGRVIIDGQDTGEWTPTGEIQLAPGRHIIELVDNQNIRRRAVVQVVKGQLLNLDVPPPKMVP